MDKRVSCTAATLIISCRALTLNFFFRKHLYVYRGGGKGFRENRNRSHNTYTFTKYRPKKILFKAVHNFYSCTFKHFAITKKKKKKKKKIVKMGILISNVFCVEIRIYTLYAIGDSEQITFHSLSLLFK